MELLGLDWSGSLLVLLKQHQIPRPVASAEAMAEMERSVQGLLSPEHFAKLEAPPLEHPRVPEARRILAAWSDARFHCWWNSTCSFLAGLKPREVLPIEPEHIVAAARDQYEHEL